MLCGFAKRTRKKKIGRNPKSDRDWKDRKKIELSRNKSPNKKG